MGQRRDKLWLALLGWEGNTDGWAFSPSEAENAAERPQLYVEWLPADVAFASFRQGVGGYSGTVDTRLLQSNADGDYSAATTIWSDAADADADNESQILMRFDDFIGNGLDQVPPGATIYAAVLDLATIGSSATGDGAASTRCSIPGRHRHVEHVERWRAGG